MITSDSVSFAAVIVAAGSGSRFGGSVPKQFATLGGIRVLDHSIRVFSGLVDTVIAVLPPGDQAVQPEVITVPGGSRRQDSVLNGVLAAVEAGASHVLIHDGARPAVTVDLIERVMAGTLRSGCCIPCIPVNDTVKTVSGASVTGTVDRSRLRLAQTPQGFQTATLAEVLRDAPDITDEASAMEQAGYTVETVTGSLMNRKVTTGEDLELLERQMCGGRTVSATGLDFHRFTGDRALVVCGCRLSDTGGLMGHSDGDVVLHAVADAVLAAARAGDIGTHFPPGRAEWKDADSSVLLKRCMNIVREKGFELEQLDVTVIGDTPRISPLRDMFLARLSDILDIPEARIWIKGTTTNSLGDLGRGEGLGCLALARLRTCS